MTTYADWPGAGLATYRFHLYSMPVEFLPLGGVYVICRVITAHDVAPLYVGQTDNLHDRLNAGAMDHEGLERALLEGATHISALVVHDATERIRIETELRHRLNPPCNKQPVPMSIGRSLF